MELEKEIVGFIKYLENIRNLSIHTLRNYHLDLMRFFEYLDNQKIDKTCIRLYILYLNNQKISKRTILRHLSALRAFFLYLKKNQRITFNPMEGIKNPKREHYIPYVLSCGEVERLFSQPNIECLLGLRDRTIMELFYSSGIRLSELVGVDRNHFCFNTRQVRVYGKGRKERVLPVTPNACAWVRRYLSDSRRYANGSMYQQKDSKAIFLNKWGERISVRSIDRMFGKYLLTSGLSKVVTPHTIRHTIATHWLESGMDIKTIQMLLGHQSIGTTTLYTQVSTQLKQDVYMESHPRAKK